MKMVKVTGTNFVRDINSMGLSDTNQSVKDEYYSKLKLINNQKTEINKVNQEINHIKSEMSEIKDLLKQLLVR
jgi:uncharacterized phage infection (PIP) family protein YhgE